MLLINQRIIDSCFSKFERRVRHNTRFFLKISFFLPFKEKINTVANGYKNSRWQR
jgi:TRAP-type mannitol/chloroaromatic compound transport system permease small subunit